MAARGGMDRLTDDHLRPSHGERPGHRAERAPGSRGVSRPRDFPASLFQPAVAPRAHRRAGRRKHRPRNVLSALLLRGSIDSEPIVRGRRPRLVQRAKRRELRTERHLSHHRGNSDGRDDGFERRHPERSQVRGRSHRIRADGARATRPLLGIPTECLLLGMRDARSLEIDAGLSVQARFECLLSRLRRLAGGECDRLARRRRLQRQGVQADGNPMSRGGRTLRYRQAWSLRPGPHGMPGQPATSLQAARATQTGSLRRYR